MAEIVVKYENKVIERIVTEKRRLSIGRTNDNDIVLENRGVSRKHAMIEFNDGAAILLDNESLNGTFINSRKISEEVLRDADVITIGKYQLVYQAESTAPVDDAAGFDGTMVLNTKAHKKLMENDRKERELVDRYGGSLLLGGEQTDFSEYRLDRDVVTIGKAKFVHVRAKGFWLSGIQAKIVRDGDCYSLVNLGRKGKTCINGEPIDRQELKNDDLISVGKSTFKYVEGKR
ncbi:MAG: FHA domain-containing protein [candidate division Zixibacteria bacterium]|nr:FHA domain-containing protein [candidate division Zixibacteria bacterium]